MTIVTSLLVALAALAVVFALIVRPDRYFRVDRLSTSERRRLARTLPAWARLDDRRRGRLLKTTARIRREVSIIGGDGLTLDANQRLCVAGQIALCSLAPEASAQRLPDEIVIYPGVPATDRGPGPTDLIEDLGELATGQSWASQRLTASWQALTGAWAGDAAHPLVRQLIAWRVRGLASGEDDDRAGWLPAFARAQQAATPLAADAAHADPIALPREAELALFIGHAAEAFFQRGPALARQDAALYELMAIFFDLDTARQRPAGHRTPRIKRR